MGVDYDSASYLVPGRTATEAGRSGVWVQAQQMVWRPSMSDSRGLTLFADAYWNIAGFAPLSDYYAVGLWEKGTFASRPADSIGLAYVLSRLSSRIENGFTKALAANGGGHLSQDEGYLELNYGFELAPGMEIKPFLQYIRNPDQFGTGGAPNAKLRSAFGFGAIWTVVFQDLLGLPSLRRLN